MNPSSTTSNPLDSLPLPAYAGLTKQQRRGTTCVWDGAPLTTPTAMDLGERHAEDGTSWFPRACRPCTLRRGMETLQSHSDTCEQCVDDHTQCETGVALVRLVREARR